MPEHQISERPMPMRHRFTFRYFAPMPGQSVGGIARLPDVDGKIVLVLLAVNRQNDPDRQAIFEALDPSWIETGKPLVAFEIPRGAVARDEIRRVVLATNEDGHNRPRWSTQEALPHEIAFVFEGLLAIGYFSPDHPENGGRAASVRAAFGPASAVPENNQERARRSASILKFRGTPAKETSETEPPR